MRFLCSSCERLAPISSFRAEDLSLVLVCARCGAENRATIEQASRSVAAPDLQSIPTPAVNNERSTVRASYSSDSKVIPLRPFAEDAALTAFPGPNSTNPFAVPPGRCPKCIAAVKEGAESCPHCGLVFSNVQPDEYRPSAPLSELWTELVSSWDDTAVHERLLARAAAQGELAGIGRLYRLRLAIAPDDPLALRGRDEVLRLASVPSILNTPLRESEDVAVSSLGGTPTRRWWIWVAFGFTLVALLGVALVVWKSVAPRM